MAGSELVAQGVELMLIGMGTVFVFLTLLVFTTAAMSKLVALLPQEEIAVPAAHPAAGAAPSAPDGSDNSVIAAISMAIHRHRSRQDK